MSEQSAATTEPEPTQPSVKANRIHVAEANAQQLRTFGRVVLGLDLKGTENCPTMISKFAEAGFTGETIPDLLPTMPTAPDERPSGPVRNRRPNKLRPNEEEDFLIQIHTQPGPGGSDPVKLAVNGVAMLVPRGKPEWVPARYVEVLENGVEFVYDEYDPGIDEGRGGLREPRRVNSYPFSYV